MSVNGTISKTTRSIGLALLATMATLSFTAPMQAAPNQAQYNQFIASLGTTPLGTNATFQQQVSMTLAGPVTLYWKTTTQNVAQGKWQVTNKASGPALLSGFVPPPAPGQAAQFQIDFSKIASKDVPEADNPTLYYVTIQPVGGNNIGLAPQSNWVKVIYAKAK